MANVIVKTFTVNESIETPATLYPRSDGRWSSFQNTYAVWPTTGNEVKSYIIKRIFTAPYSGTYYFRSTVDNSGSVSVDGIAVGGTANFNQTPSPVAVTLTAGTHTLQFNVSNGGDVAGFACTISNTSNSVIWDTRTYAAATTPRIGRYLLTVPCRVSVTAHVWGAGGGGGGMDAGSQGGLGSPGMYNTHTFIVERNQQIEVIVGRHGAGGGSNAGGSPGGSGGLSRTAITGENAYSFNGGDGTAAGPSPSSGGGGGGGGASAILVDNSPVVVAGGGGGGGGAGNDGNGPYARRDATITNNTTGNTPSDYRGQNGQSKGGDGGGAGGGGGGYPGGRGGAVVSGDASGYAGQTGGNLPTTNPLTGEGTQYYQNGYATGGQRGGGNGQPGRVVIEITPLGTSAIKLFGTWRSVDETFVKVNGTWRSVDETFVKVDGTWRTVESAGDGLLSEFSDGSSNYGKIARPYS